MFDLRARSNAEIIDVSIELFKKNFMQFFPLYLVAAVPAAFGQILMTNKVNSYLLDANPASMNSMMGPMLFGIVSLFFWLILPPISAIIASNAYLGKPKESIATIFERIKPNILSIIHANIVKWILIGFGLALFIVPGLFALRYYFTLSSTLGIENLKSRPARKRSGELGKGNMKRILLVGVIPLILILILPAFITYIVGQIIPSPGLGIIIAMLVNATLYPLYEVIATIFYYDVRIRNEGLDIELMADKLDTQALIENQAI